MKDSGIDWIGEIPIGWKIEKGKTVFYQSRDKGNEVEVLLSATQKNGMCPQSQLEGVVQVKEDTDLQSFKTVHINDYVISLRSFQGGFEMSEYEGVCSPAYTVFRSRGAINNIYFKYLFKTQPFIDKINSFYQGIREGKSIHFEEFALMDITVPTLPEQRSIATYLDTKCAEIDELVALQDKMIDELKAYKQSVITEAVTKGLDPNVKMKDSGVEWIGEVPEHWEVKRTKNVVLAMEKGNGITKEEVFANGDTPCVRYGEIYSKYNYSFERCYSSTNRNILPTLRYFQYGDLLSAGTGELVEEIGKTIAYLGEEMCLAGGDIIIIKHNQNPMFLSYALNSHYAQAQKSCSKAKLKVVHISATDIADVMLVVPPLSEQRSIATYLATKCSEIDSLIAIKQKKIEELKEYKKSLIYECVTGKKEVV